MWGWCVSGVSFLSSVANNILHGDIRHDIYRVTSRDQTRVVMHCTRLHLTLAEEPDITKELGNNVFLVTALQNGTHLSLVVRYCMDQRQAEVYTGCAVAETHTHCSKSQHSQQQTTDSHHCWCCINLQRI